MTQHPTILIQQSKSTSDRENGVLSTATTAPRNKEAQQRPIERRIKRAKSHDVTLAGAEHDTTDHIII
eukprot:7916597-Pyramimonas_sp.AAC.1